MPALAKELVNRNVAVIAATGDVVSAQAAQAATATIPIVFTVGSDPVRFGLVKSLNLPGGNLTGMTLFSSTLVAKRMDLLTQLIPAASLIALFMNPDNTNAETDVRDAQEAARALGRQTIVVNARSEREFNAAFATIVEQRCGAALIASDPYFKSTRSHRYSGYCSRRSNSVLGQGICCGWRIGKLRHRRHLDVSSSWNLLRANTQGGKASRPSCSATDQIRFSNQPQNSPITWHRNSVEAFVHRRRSDRIGVFREPYHHDGRFVQLFASHDLSYKPCSCMGSH